MPGAAAPGAFRDRFRGPALPDAQTDARLATTRPARRPAPQPGCRRSDPRRDRALLHGGAGIALVFIVVSFGWLVWGRYVMNNTPTWVEQSSMLLMAWIAFLGAAVGVWRNTHLGIDFVREAMPRAPRLVLRVIADLYVIVFGGFMAWHGTLLVLGNLDRQIPMLGLAEAWRAAPLVICGGLMILFAGVRLATGRRAE